MNNRNEKYFQDKNIKIKIIIITIKLLNKLILYFINADDQSKRKKIMHWLMKFLQNRYGK